MKKIIFSAIFLIILASVSCNNDPLREAMAYRSKYIVKTLGFNLVRDENGDPAYLNVEFAIENKNSKPALKYLTLKVLRYDAHDKVIGEDTIVVDVSDIGGYKLKRFIQKIPNKEFNVMAVLVKKATIGPAKKDCSKYKEFQGISSN